MATNKPASGPDVAQLLRNYQATGSTESTDAVELPKVGVQPAAAGESVTPQPRRHWRPTGVTTIDNTQEALSEGFGTSRYDSDFTEGKDVEESRAIAQSDFSKIGTGFLKGGVTAATTALNTTVGTVFGIGSALYELAADSNGNGRGVMDTMDAGVNNWLSQQLTKIQQWSEEQFPNYRTSEERSDRYQREWYRPSHFFSANNIGDNILKNFGFTVGAIAGGAAWARLLGVALSKQLAGNIMKGAVAAAEGDAEVSTLLRTAAEAVQRGEATAAQKALARAGEAVSRGTAAGIDAAAIKANVDAAAKALTKYGAQMQLYGGLVGAMGEGTVEGIMANDEFHRDYDAELQRWYENRYNNLEQEVYAENNPRWSSLRITRDGDGNESAHEQLSEEGLLELERRRRELTDEFRRRQQLADEEGDRIASTTYLLNLPILTASNTIQFGRLLSGGWKTSKTLSGLTGGVSIEGGKIAANYAAKGSKATKTVLGSLKVAGTESFEEMAQGTVSSGAQRVAKKNLSAYNNDGYNAEAVESVLDWFSEMYEGGKEYLSDIKNWQEGAIGGLTGLFGIPGKSWSGGIIGAYQEARDEIDATRTAAENLNRLVNSEDFQKNWHNYIRHLTYESEMSDALAKDNEYAWHNANDKSLINDIITFADAGRLEDLNQIVSYYGSIGEADAQSIRNALGEDSWARNLSDSEVIDKVKKQAAEMADVIKEYKDTYYALSAIAQQGTTDAQKKEMLFTSMQINAFDKRFLQMFGEVMQALDSPLQSIAKRDESGRFVKKEEAARQFEEWRNGLESALGKNVLTTNIPVELDEFLREMYYGQFKELLSDNPEAYKKLEDMIKMSKSRRAFYEKLQTLKNISPETFADDAMSQEKVEAKTEEVFAEQQTENLNSIMDVKRAYYEKKANEKANFLKNLAAVESKNPAVKEFLALKRRAEEFRGYIQHRGISVDDALANPAMISSVLNDMERRAKSEQDYINAVDGIFPSLDEFTLAFTGPFGAPNASTFTAIKKAIKQAMQDYLRADSQTATRKAMSEKPAEVKQDDASSESPSGRDAAQPASAEPTPVAKEASPEAQQIIDGFSGLAQGLHESLQELERREREKEINKWLQSDNVSEELDRHAKKVKTPEELIEAVLKDNPNVSDDTKTALREALKIESSRGILVSHLKEAEPVEVASISQGTPDTTFDTSVESAHPEESIDTSDSSDEEGRTLYLHTSVPEIDSGEAAKARDAMMNPGRKNARADFESADLSDFVLKHPEYAEIWNALSERGGFENVATRLEVGDEIEFIVDPTFPTYNGRYQVLMTTVKNGDRLVLNILSKQVDKYSGLYSLHQAIDAEYKAFSEQHPNDVFVFSKKTHVWAKPAGLIEYDFSGAENAIIDIPSYLEDAPIVFIDRTGTPILVRGKDKTVLNKVSSTFQDTAYNLEKGNVGNLYYLVKTDKDKYAPIALRTAQYDSETSAVDNSTNKRIKKILSDIADVVRNSTSANLQEQNILLRNALQELSEVLDIHNDFFEIGDYDQVGVALRYSSAVSDEGKLFRPDQITEEKFDEFVAGLGRHYQMRLKDGKLPTLSTYVKEGLITSNAKRLRPKGVDFYTDPYLPGKKRFGPATEAQIAAAERRQASSQAERAAADQEMLSDADFDFSDRDSFTGNTTEPAQGEREIQRRAAVDDRDIDTMLNEQISDEEKERMGVVSKSFDELSAEYKADLERKGYSKDDYDSASDMLRERMLFC